MTVFSRINGVVLECCTGAREYEYLIVFYRCKRRAEDGGGILATSVGNNIISYCII